MERLHALLLGHRCRLDRWHRVLARLQVRGRVRPVTGVGRYRSHVSDRRCSGALWRHPWLLMMHAGERMVHAGRRMVHMHMPGRRMVHMHMPGRMMHAGRSRVHAGRLRYGLLLC